MAGVTIFLMNLAAFAMPADAANSAMAITDSKAMACISTEECVCPGDEDFPANGCECTTGLLIPSLCTCGKRVLPA